MQKIFDAVRGCYVAALPEEIVRQKLISQMIQDLGFPKSLIAVEKEIDALPHMEHNHKTNRRADIICFAKNIHPEHELYPLLVIECKAHPVSEAVIQQVLGYNHKLKAPFVAIADPNDVFTFWYHSEKKAYQKVSGLPSYADLLKAVQRRDH